MTCPGCNASVDPGWQYCVFCAAPLGERASGAAREHLVTVVVSDLKGSTALAERLDPERLRAVLDDYFDELGAVLESYGGRIEKRIGDAMVTVFGLPTAQPDDAVRAVAAVAEAQATLAALNDRLDRSFAVRLVNRTGVATGSVVFIDAGGGHRMLAGPAFEMASALEPVAPPLEALLAPSTADLVEEVAELEWTDVPGTARAAAPVRAARLVSVAEGVDRAVGADTDGCCPACGAALAPVVGPDASGNGLPFPLWKWCPQCAAPIISSAKRRDSRRTLTIVFGDLQAVTDDAGAAQQATARCFEALRGALERHGGTVEKYIGDAVMAVFGLVQRNEDDAMRAIKAALEMQHIVDAINSGAAGIEIGEGVVLELRIGVNTGPVIAGDPRLGQRLVTGDAVNVAARLEQTAFLGAVVIGGLTRRLAGPSALVIELEPLTLKGKSEPVKAYRVLEIDERAGRGDARPMIGRGRELSMLASAFLAAERERVARRVDIIGDPGIGKSRVVQALADRVKGRATVLRGACLPYGEGITFWPVLEILAEAAGFGSANSAEEVRAAIGRAVHGDEAASARLASLAGVYDVQYPLAELFWAVRILLEHAALERPVIVVFEGFQWAEPTLRDLVQSVQGSVQDASVLLLTVARSDADGDVSHESPDALHIGPLSEQETDTLIQSLLGARLPKELMARIRSGAAGNPLFVEQFLTMLVDDERLVATGEGGVWRLTGAVADLSVPPSVEALLASRVDSLGDGERGALEPAAVIGPDFARDAVLAVLAHESPVDDALAQLGTRRLIEAHPEPDVVADHRFRSLMLRDVVYDGLLKRDRWGMHLRYAEWLESLPELEGRLVEFEEVLGYHLERSYVFAGEVASAGDGAAEIGRRASRYLASAGDRAWARGDMHAAANLLGRATTTLAPDDVERPPLALRAGEARVETGEFKAALELFAEAEAAGERRGDDALVAAARLARVVLRYQSGDGVTDAEALAEVGVLTPALRAAGDQRSLARGHYVEMLVELTHCQFGATEVHALASVSAARAAGDLTMEGRTLPLLSVVALHGPLPVDEAVPLCEGIVERLGADRRSQAMAERYLGVLLAMQDRMEEGRALCETARDLLAELGWQFDLALVGLELGPLEMMADRPEAAEAALRAGYEELDAMGEQNYISTVAALLAESLCRQGRHEEAEGFAARAAEVAAPDDVITQAFVRAVQAKVASARGEHAIALAVAQEAVDLLAATDDINSQADVLFDLALVTQAAGDRAGALVAAEASRHRYSAKGCRPGARRAGALVHSLTAG